MSDRYLNDFSPEIPHLSRGEVADLRRDVAKILQRLGDEMDLTDTRSIQVKMLDAPDLSGGPNSVTVGFSLETETGNLPVAGVYKMQFAAFDDLDLVVPSTIATLATATKGRILFGEGTEALIVETDANGEFECTLTFSVFGAAHMACSEYFGSPSLTCVQQDVVTYSA
jgi:hypothetical protein